MKNTLPSAMAALLICGQLAASGCNVMPREALADFQRPGVPPRLITKIRNGGALDIQDIEVLCRADVQTGSIIYYLYSFGRHFRLTPEDISELRRNGAGADVISYMESPEARPHLFAF